MKYNLLAEFRAYISGVCPNKNTADRYYFAAQRLLNGFQFDRFQDIPPSFLEQRLSACRNKNQFSAAKNALKHLEAFSGGTLRLPTEDFFDQTAKAKRNRSVRPEKLLITDKISRKINALRDEKLRYAYRLMMASGLRVSETAGLTRQDISFDEDGGITLNVRHGKGGANGLARCLPDEYLSRELPVFLETLSPDEKLFYPAQTMKDRAVELGLECHNFRRIAAMSHRNGLLKEGADYHEANDETRKFLRHARFSTTKRYLSNRKLKFKNLTPSQGVRRYRLELEPPGADGRGEGEDQV